MMRDLLAQESTIPDSTTNFNTNFHFQLTSVTQYHFAMKAPYTGNNSLSKGDESRAKKYIMIIAGKFSIADYLITMPTVTFHARNF